MKMRPTFVAFVPARSGSKRVPNKNLMEIDGHPILAYSIKAALSSRVFDSVICVTDSPHYASVAQKYGAEVPFLRPDEISTDQSPDIEWVIWALNELKRMGRNFDGFSILRPTSPFRTSNTIKKAMDLFLSDQRCDSIRAVQKCKEHPGKMWILQGSTMYPLLPFSINSTPWHSNQYSSLPDIYVQNASLEISWTKNPIEHSSISGDVIKPFITEGLEGFDINNIEDVILARYYVENKMVSLSLNE